MSGYKEDNNVPRRRADSGDDDVMIIMKMSVEQIKTDGHDGEVTER